MATNRTDSLIASSGGDYSTIQSWEDDIGVGLGSSTNLVTDDYDHYGWLAAEEFDEEPTIGGHTSNSTHHIYLAADSNGATTAASQHGGTKTDAALMDADRALTYNSSYASLLFNDSYGSGLTVSDDYVDISRLQFYGASGTRTCLNITGSYTVVRRILLHVSFSSTPVVCALTDTIESSIFIGPFDAVSSSLRKFTCASITNCTVVRSSTSSYSSTAAQFMVDYDRPAIENCAFFSGGAGTEYLHTNGGTAWTTLDYNCTDHSDLSSKSGEGSNNTYSLTQSDQFTAVDNTDWRLKSGNDLDGAGTDKTGTVPYDIFGNAFSSSSPTVGCENYATGASTQTITPTNLSSASSVYDPTLTTDVTISAPYLASASQVYEPTVSGAAIISADYLASNSQVFEPTLSTEVTISADYLASASQVYAPTLTTEATISADYLASSSQVFDPTLTTEVTVSADYLASASQVFDPTLTVGQTISADYLASSAQVYGPTITTVVTISADYLSSNAQVYDPSVTAEQTISADYLASASAVYQPTLLLGQNISADYLASAAAVYQPTITTQVTISADYLASNSQVYEPTVAGASTISADYLSSNSQVYEPTLSGGTLIQPDYLASASVVYEPTLTTTVTISVDYLASNSQVYDPAVTAEQTISSDYVASASAVYDPTLSSSYTITAEYVASTSAVYAPTLTTVVTITPGRVASSQVIYQPNIIGGTQDAPVPTAWHTATIEADDKTFEIYDDRLFVVPEEDRTFTIN